MGSGRFPNGAPIHPCPGDELESAIDQNKAIGILLQRKGNINNGNASIGRSQRMTAEIEFPVPPYARANSPHMLTGTDNTTAITTGSLEMLAFLSCTLSAPREGYSGDIGME
jgi:hypothetical protein